MLKKQNKPSHSQKSTDTPAWNRPVLKLVQESKAGKVSKAAMSEMVEIQLASLLLESEPTQIAC